MTKRESPDYAEKPKRTIFSRFFKNVVTFLAFIGGFAIVLALIVIIFAFKNPQGAAQILNKIHDLGQGTNLTGTEPFLTLTETAIVATQPESTQPRFSTNTPSDNPTDSSTSTPTPKSTDTPLPSFIPTMSVKLPFSDNFDKGSSPLWQPVTGKWRMVDGCYTPDPSPDWSMTFIGDTQWTDYAVDVDVFYYNTAPAVQMIVRTQDNSSYLSLFTTLYDTKWILSAENTTKTLAESRNSGLTHFGYGRFKNHLRVEVKGDIYTAYTDGNVLLQVQDDTFMAGKVGLAVINPKVNGAEFDNFQVTALH